MLTVHLSYNGSPPILQVIAMVTGSEGEHQLHNRSGPYLPGDTVYIPLEGLQEGVQYECFAYAVNYAGAGHLSNRHTFSIPGKLYHVLQWGGERGSRRGCGHTTLCGGWLHDMSHFFIALE